ncbi:MAG: efflux RND transporter permease subunit [Verrucomicrobiota bacterium]
MSAVTPELQQKGTIAWFARNPVAANLLLFLIVTAGLLSTFSIEKTAMPRIALDLITVQMSYPGASPTEIERGICIKVEEALRDIEGIKKIESTAREGFGTVALEVEPEYDISEILDEVNIAIGSIFTFPENAEKPIVSRTKIIQDLIDIQIYGDIDEFEMTRLAKEIRLELLNLGSVSRVDLDDIRPYEIAIEVSENKLQQHQVSLDDVAQAVRFSSVDLPAGVIKTDAFDLRLRTEGKAYTGKDFEEIVLKKTPDGGRVLIGDVAEVNDGFEEDRRNPRFNGKPSVSLSVYSVGGQSELELAQIVRDYVAEKQLELPEGVKIDTWLDVSFYLKGRLNMMIENLALGAFLVFILLGLFLKLKVAFWVVVGIPVCFLGTLWLMPQFEVSVNMLSLFGFILVLGILVDDAIVIGENIYSYVELNGPSEENVIAGARQVALPATFGVLTTIASFIPMLMIEGAFGPLWKAIGAVVVLALVFSLIESKWILPSHLMSLGRPGSNKQPRGPIAFVQGKIDSGLKHVIQHIYRPLLEKALQFRYATVALFVGSLILTGGVVAGGIIRFVFFPSLPSDFLVAQLQMENGMGFSDLQSAMVQIEDAMVEVDAEIESAEGEGVVKHLRTSLSSRSSGFMVVELNKSEARSIDGDQISRMWSEAIGDIAGVETFEIGGGNDDFPALSVNLFGDDLAVLKEAAEDFSEEMTAYPGIFNESISLTEGPREAVLSITPEAEAMGLTLGQIASQVRAGFYGIEAQRIQRGEDEVKVMVRYPADERGEVNDLESMFFRLPNGTTIPFTRVASVEFKTGYSAIQRLDSRRTVNINAMADRSIAEPEKIARELEGIFDEKYAERYPGIDFKLTGQSQDAQESLGTLATGLFLAMLVVYALMAIPLKSYVQPLIIMSVIPFGFIGAAVGHWILGLPISVLSMCGLIALAGVVVNDSLVMVDFVNQGVRKGVDITSAARDAGIRRFRAILLTSLTTFIGLIPILSESSLQAQIVVPMAVTLAFGILFSTLVTLILIPTLYLIIDDIKGLFRRRV